MSGPDSLELVLIMKKNERKKERLRNDLFLTSGSGVYN